MTKKKALATPKQEPQPLKLGPAFLPLSRKIIETGWDHLNELRTQEMYAYVSQSPAERIAADTRDVVVWDALRGDNGMMANLLPVLVGKTSKGEPLTSGEAFGLCVVLSRIYRSPKGLQLACGADKKRGGTRQGAKAFVIALEVIREISDGTANSLEEAWAATAAKRHMSESAVKKCWMERKAQVLGVLQKPANMTAAEMVAESVAEGRRHA